MLTGPATTPSSTDPPPILSTAARILTSPNPNPTEKYSCTMHSKSNNLILLICEQINPVSTMNANTLIKILLLLMTNETVIQPRLGAKATKPTKLFTGKDIIPQKTYKTVSDYFDVKSKFKTIVNTCPMHVDLGKIKITLDKNGLTAKKINSESTLESISLAKKIDDDFALLTTDELKREYCKKQLKHRLFDATSTFSSNEIDQKTIVTNNDNTETGMDFGMKLSILDSGIMALEKLQQLCKVDESIIANAQTKMLKRLDLIAMDQPTGELPCQWKFCINDPAWGKLTTSKIILAILVSIELVRNTVSRFNITRNDILQRKPRRIDRNETGVTTSANNKLSIISYIITLVMIGLISIPNKIIQNLVCGKVETKL